MAMTWQTTHSYGGNSLAHQFPSFQISAEDARRGNVRVEARAPSGRITDLGVTDSNGVFQANFTPTEVGDWTISIMYDNEHIQGSPFNVRVYDAAQVKVFGLEGGAVGKTFSFNADCTGAGEGTLQAEITHNGRSVPVNIYQEGRGLYRVNFTPDGAGVYTIRVYFAGMEVSGSPYTLEIVDSSMVTASGEGLSNVAVNKAVSFMVNTRGAGGGDIRVNISSPSGGLIPCQVSNAGDDTYRVEYTPTDVGEYQIEVLFFGKPISGSPFRVQVYDWNRIYVRNLPNQGTVGKTVEFDIDAGQAGSGNLEIMVNDGTIPCNVQNRGNRQFHASFTPEEPKPHFIQMRFNGRDVPGSPWRVNARGAAHVTVATQSLSMLSANRTSSFEVRTGVDGGNLVAYITSPTGRVVPNRVLNQYGGIYRVEWTPVEAGTYNIDLTYDGIQVPNSPFTAKVYNSQGITVGQIPAGSVGKPVEFTIDVNSAGEGQLEIMINRGSVPNSVRMLRKGVYSVSFVPRTPQTHTVDIKFNGELAPGCPINVPVLDASRVTVHGEGLHQVAVNRQSHFRVNTQEAGMADLSVRVTAPSGADVPAKVTGSGLTGYEVQYFPNQVGNHKVELQYGGAAVQGSPFLVKVYNSGQVHISGLKDGAVNKESKFIVDVSAAGEGNMEISVGAGGKNIPNKVQQIAPGRFEVSYTPVFGGIHLANVLFNKEQVPGTPMQFNVLDASKVLVTGDGLGLVPCHKTAHISILAPECNPADLAVRVTGPDGRQVLSRINDLGNSREFQGEYTPNVPGDHKIEVTYAGTSVSASPFSARVYDASKVNVANISRGIIGRPVSFNVDASRAGAGNLEIIVSTGGQNVPNFVKSEGNARFEVSFTPVSRETHMINIKFNGDVVPGSPFTCMIVDVTSVVATGTGLQSARANQVATFSVSTMGAGEALLEVNIRSPSGKLVPSRALGSAYSGYQVEYTPTEVGQHKITVKFAENEIQGSPFTAEIYDPTLVQVTPIAKGILGKPVVFEVDASMAGEGTLTVDVRDPGGSVLTDLKQKGAARYEVVFTPTNVNDHTADITFNGERIPGAPLTIKIEDPVNNMMVIESRSHDQTSVNKDAWLIIGTRGLSADQGDFVTTMTAPNGELVPAKIVMQPDGDYKVEYSSRYTGRHMVEILYSGQPIMGSPFYVEIYDPNKLVIDGDRGGIVGSHVNFEVNRVDAGKAELGVVITSPSGQRIPFDTTPTQVGERFSYIPTEPGVHNIFVTYGGLDVPGCPLKQDITDNSTVNAFGDGLYHGEEDNIVTFHVDTKGVRGDLFVQVDGPNSIAKCNIEPESPGRYLVNYVPVEVGTYSVQIKWNGREIAGSPYHPIVVNPRKIGVIGGWESHLDQSGAIAMTVNERKRIEFNTGIAGPAKLTAEVRDPDGRLVASDIEYRGDKTVVSFVPIMEGNYHIDLRYAGIPLPRSPFLAKSSSAAYNASSGYGTGLAGAAAAGAASGYAASGASGYSHSMSSSVQQTTTTTSAAAAHSVDHNKVVLQGHGLKEARVKEESDFIIDGSQAGPVTKSGKPQVRLSGMKQDIHVDVVDVGGDKYKCTYTPQIPGAYLLHIAWSEFPVKGSPFKVNVIAPGDATKVLCSGEGLKTGVIGKEIKSVIDTRRAGPGELTAYCMGPTKVANCELYDHRNGTFTLNIKPQEAGRHQLHIKYGGQHVQGSPFTLKVAGAPDASKVRVTGPGILPGILARYKSYFICETKGAGAGQLTVRIRGPKGAFRVEMQRSSQKDRTIHCRYDPTEVGDYIIHVKWSGEHVPGSPFKVQIFDTMEELQRFQAANPAPVNYSHMNNEV